MQSNIIKVFAPEQTYQREYQNCITMTTVDPEVKRQGLQEYDTA